MCTNGKKKSYATILGGILGGVDVHRKWPSSTMEVRNASSRFGLRSRKVKIGTNRVYVRMGASQYRIGGELRIEATAGASH